MITLLQISDIHFKNENIEADELTDVKDAFLDDIAGCKVRLGKIDHLLVCGDVANKGQEDEYKDAKNYLSLIMLKTECSSIFFVPGNHDVDRQSNEVVRKYLSASILKNQDTFLPTSAKEALLKPILRAFFSPFINYYKFVSSFNEEQPRLSVGEQKMIDKDSELLQKDSFKYEVELGQEGNYTISLTCANSAILSDGESHSDILPKQFYRKRFTPDKVSIFMCHHPLKAIENGTNIEAELDSKYQIQLFGHEHKQSIDKGRNSIRIHSGAFGPDCKDAHDKKEWFPVYNVIRLFVEGDTLVIENHARRWDWDRREFRIFEECTKKLTLDLKKKNSWEDADIDLKESTKDEDSSVKNTSVARPSFNNTELSWPLYQQLRKEEQDEIQRIIFGTPSKSITKMVKQSITKEYADKNSVIFGNALISYLTSYVKKK